MNHMESQTALGTMNTNTVCNKKLDVDKDFIWTIMFEVYYKYWSSQKPSVLFPFFISIYVFAISFRSYRSKN